MRSRLSIMVALLILLGARGEAQPRISVGLLRASRPDSVSVSCSTGLMLSAGQDNPAGIAKRILISASGRSVQLASDRLHKKLFPALIVASSGGSAITITVHGVSISYRGVLRLSSRGGHLLITNEVLLEDYVRGVVASEMRSDWPSEVLKAQAVVARTLAVARIRRHRSEGFDICDTTHCQVYRGRSGETAATNAAVRATADQILTSVGAPIEPLYCSTCGGTIASAFGSRALDHLIVQRDLLKDSSACKASPHFTWTSSIPAADLAAALRSDRRTNPGGRLDDILIVQRDMSGRAKYIEVRGEKNKEVDGYVLWNVVCRKLGWATLKSARFNVTKSGKSFVFHGHGLGHGIGMCQWGARKRAKSGWDYRRILKFYYPGCQLNSQGFRH